MNLLDWLILLGIGLGAWRGFSKGLIHEVARLLGLLVAFLLGVALMDQAGKLLVKSTGISDKVAPLVGFVVVFLGGLAGIYLIARFVEWLIGTLKLGPVNRLLGGVLGALKSAVILSLVFIFLLPWNLPPPAWREQSRLYAAVVAVGPTAWEVLNEMWPGMERFSRQVQALMDEALAERSSD